MKAFKLCLIFMALAIFVAACNQTPSTPNTPNPPDTTRAASAPKNTTDNAPAQPASPAQPADELAAAKELYATNCMTCHRDTGKGGKVTIEGKTIDPNDLTSDKMKNRSDDKLAKQIADGAPDDGMPAFKDKLKDDEIKAVVKYVRSLQGK